MLKIFHLISSVKLGGAENVAINLALKCPEKYPSKFKPFILEIFKSNNKYSIEKKNYLKRNNITFYSLSIFPKRISLFFTPIILAYYVFKLNPHIIHSHTDLPDFVVSNAIKLLSFLGKKRPKIVRTIHNTKLWPNHKLIGKYTEQAYKDDFIVGVSELALRAYFNLRKDYNLPISRHQALIHNGFSIPEEKEFPFQLNKEQVNVAFCGRFEYQKGIDILIDRIREINLHFSNSFCFHLIGEGSYQTEVNRFGKEFDNVKVYESIPNLANKLHYFDFIIMPSRFEGLVLLSIESSYAKVPVIASISEGLKETLPVDWPLFFHLEDPAELLEVFNKIKNKEYDLDALKEKAFQFVSKNFSESRMIEEYSKIYFSLYE